MHTRTRLLLAALTAAMALTIAATTANAARSFATTSPLLTYVSPGLTFTGSPGGNEIICSVTLTASLHASVAKVRGTLIGFVNGGRFNDSCRNNIGTTTRWIALASHRLPWHITLLNFRGTLPRITEISVLINDFKFLLETREPFGRTQRCLYRGTIEVETRGRTGVAEYILELLIPKASGSTIPLLEDRLNESFAACEERLTFSGTFHANLPPVIRLI